jgi:hypothetical protein
MRCRAVEVLLNQVLKVKLSAPMFRAPALPALTKLFVPLKLKPPPHPPLDPRDVRRGGDAGVAGGIHDSGAGQLVHGEAAR